MVLLRFLFFANFYDSMYAYMGGDYKMILRVPLQIGNISK